MNSIYDFSCHRITGEKLSLATFKHKVLLIVNTASKCGFTPQFQGLEELYQRFQVQGFEVLGFPCNQFGSQDPGTQTEIHEFCQTKFGVSFPMFEKIDVNGPETHPLYHYLKHQAPGLLGTEAIKWNFTKFLVNRSGDVKKRLPPTTKPEEIATAIQNLLRPG